MNYLKMEYIKLKHTKFYTFQLIVTLGVTFLLTVFYYLYSNRMPEKCIRTIFECLGLVIPLEATLTCYFMVHLEEQVSNLWGMLFVEKKISSVFGKIAFMGIAEIPVLIIPGIVLFILNSEGIIAKDILGLALGYLYFSIIFNCIHIFINLKFGGSISIFLGIIETVIVIFASNVQFVGIYRYLPSAILMEWKDMILNHTYIDQMYYVGNSIILSLVILCAIIAWFRFWQGRKNTGTM